MIVMDTHIAPDPSLRSADCAQRLSAISARLNRWLLEEAFPLWWSKGADHTLGGFHERLRQDGQATNEPRRARLHPRHIYAFGFADDLGHDGMTELAVRHGLDYFLRYYVRPDGFIRGRVAPDGTVIDDGFILYDQAFALLGYAAAFDALNDDTLRDRAHKLLAALHEQLANPAGGFRESPTNDALLTSNSHMHLLEAALAWMALDHEPQWRELAAHIVALAISRFVDPESGQLREFFVADWQPAPSVQGRIVEPGHQFEWAWLLLRWSAQSHDQRAVDLALSLIALCEARGVDGVRDVAVNSMLTDGAVHDPRARLWQQTERLKAACVAWEMTRLPHYCDIAQRSANALERYLQTPVRGLWYDTMGVDGKCADEPAPASSFYHIVAALAELNGTINRIAPTGSPAQGSPAQS